MARVYEPVSPLELPANQAPPTRRAEPPTDQAGVLLPETSLQVLVVGGGERTVRELRSAVSSRAAAGGTPVRLSAVDHSREAFERVSKEAIDLLVVFDDLTGKTVLGWARESADRTPCVCIVESETLAQFDARRYELRRLGAQACVWAGDVCGPIFEAAARHALEMAVGPARAGKPSGTFSDRAAFERELDVAKARAENDPTAKLRVAYFDVGRLAGVAKSDPALAVQLRTEFETRLSAAAEGLTVGRLSMSSYAVLVPSTNTDIGHLDALHRIQGVGAASFPCGTQEVFLELGFSVVVATSRHRSAAEILATAHELARPTEAESLDAAALSGQFERPMTPALQRRQEAIRQALARNEFSLAYQPIVKLDWHKPVAFEALMRWDVDGETRAAADFIDDAERSDLIVALGYWALEAAVRQMCEWGSDYELGDQFRVNINLSTRQVVDAQLVDRIRSLVLTTGVDPSALCFEIQAESIKQAPFEARKLIGALADDGMRVWIEDFGIGECTVDELRGIPVDALKVDRTFVERLDGTSATTGRVKLIADAARALRASLIGEGIENELQRNVLRWLGCKTGQGYLFARPMTVGDAYAYLARHASARKVG